MLIIRIPCREEKNSSLSRYFSFNPISVKQRYGQDTVLLYSKEIFDYITRDPERDSSDD